MNYRDHVGEIKQEVAANPTIFTRYIDTLVGQGQPVIRPTLSETFDFEGEIAIIIGRGGRHIPVETALDHVSGYTCFMDGSVREYQRHSLTAGKNFWRSGAMGPWIVPAQNFAPADPLLETRLNGEKVQGAHASQMIFDIPHAIAYCSRFTLLRPGDVIATGTPGGVGSRREPPLWMKAGDRIEVSVEGIGTLCNSVADEG
jgi:2-keto-4-pentenoate hydratase/2-oxohepta-3-ene-1,7-dioic acid hydratase in catechol pathway